MIIMKLKNKILIIAVIIIFVSIIGVYSTQSSENTRDESGCCSIVLQLNNSDSMMTFRRDSDLDADIKIEEFSWNGIPAIKQYKEDGGYYYQVIITKSGWTIGLGGIDDGIDNERCVNYSYEMVSNGKISNDSLKKVQEIKKQYGRGHILIKSPTGDYGIATLDKIQTGTLNPGEFVSIPNNYSYYRSGNISLENPDKVKQMTKLAQSDLYGLDRRDITTYDIKVGEENTTLDVYLSNEDGSALGVDYTVYVDDVYLNGTLIKASDIPIAPEYKNIGELVLDGDSNTPMTYIVMAITVVFIIALSYGVYRLVRYIRYNR